MRWGDKGDFSKMAFQEVTPLEKLVWLHSSTDKDWQVAANPMMPNWPRTLLTTVTFKDAAEGTAVQLHQIPVDATEAEIACFAEMKGGMDNGWGKGFDIVEDVLAELTAASHHT